MKQARPVNHRKRAALTGPAAAALYNIYFQPLLVAWLELKT